MALPLGVTNERYITPITAPYPGFRVAIPIPKQPGAYVAKNFFGVAQSLEEYLRVAKIWRDRTYAKLHQEPIPVRIFRTCRRNSKTRPPGVTYVEKKVNKRRKDGTIKVYIVPCYMAQIFAIPGENYAKAKGTKSKLFSLKKYGELEAFKLAQEWRIAMENEFRWSAPDI